jgi:23S rRNA (pseudouridine1915-N3)-methyltransferase
VKVLVVVVGRVRGDLADSVKEYERRAGRYWKLEVVEVSGGGPGRDAPPKAVKDVEAERLLARIPPEIEVVALTREGRGMDSRALSGYLERHAVRSSAGVAFVIGGAFGLGEAVLSRSRRQLSLSAMTLPHEMARLVLAEQLYRAGTILRGEPYHKG